MITIEPMLNKHADQVLAIYKQGIDSGIATFETDLPTWATFSEKHHIHSRLVAVEDGEVCGWAMISPVSSRACYVGVAEVSVYVRLEKQGMGVGKKLLDHLIQESEKNGIWSLLGVIDEENSASIQLHAMSGFRKIGYRERIARLNGKWRTTVMMERRSFVIGI
jgi:L-amino acid N-acyltransferase YncA